MKMTWDEVGSSWACSGDAAGVWGAGELEGALASHPVGNGVSHSAAAAEVVAEVAARADSFPQALERHGLPGQTHRLLWLAALA